MKYIVLMLLLLVISIYDLRLRIIPNFLIVIGLVLSILFALYDGQLWMCSQGALVGASVMFIIYLASRGGTGEGDVKLALLIGLFLGYPLILDALALSYVIAGIIVLLLLVLRRVDLKYALPFAPFMALGAGISVFAGPVIWL